jgi:hypothetical protein
MSEHTTDVPYGALDLLILKTLDTMGPMHGDRVARRIEQVAENLLRFLVKVLDRRSQAGLPGQMPANLYIDWT